MRELRVLLVEMSPLRSAKTPQLKSGDEWFGLWIERRWDREIYRNRTAEATTRCKRLGRKVACRFYDFKCGMSEAVTATI